MTNKQQAYDSLLFSVRRSRRYHVKRQEFFDYYSKLSRFITAIIGIGAVVSLLSKLDTTIQLTITAIVALAATADLVLNLSDKARRHYDLARQFINLEKDMLKTPPNEVTEQQIIHYKTTRLDIESNEPPKKAILDIICHNELVKAMGIQNETYHITPIQNFLSNYKDFQLCQVRKAATH